MHNNKVAKGNVLQVWLRILFSPSAPKTLRFPLGQARYQAVMT